VTVHITTHPETAPGRIGTHSIPDRPRPVISITSGGPGRVHWAIRDEADQGLASEGAYAAGHFLTSETPNAEKAARTMARAELVTVLRIILDKPAIAERRKETEALLGVCGWESKLENSPYWLPAIEELLALGLARPDGDVPGILLSPTDLGSEVAIAIMSRRTGIPSGRSGRRAGVPG
jgi:hypothetical protein